MSAYMIDRENIGEPDHAVSCLLPLLLVLRITLTVVSELTYQLSTATSIHTIHLACKTLRSSDIGLLRGAQSFCVPTVVQGVYSYQNYLAEAFR